MKKEIKDNKFIKNFDKILFTVNKFFSLPILVIIFLTWLSNSLKDTEFGKISNYVLVAVFVVWLFIVLYKIFRRIVKFNLIWPLIFSLICLICCCLTAYSNENGVSDVLYIIGIILMEIYFIYLIVICVYSRNNNLSNLIIISLLFIIIGYYSIYYFSYNLDDKNLFNSLITLFSAMIGGGLTLSGVAWTIKNEMRNRKNEERLKAKPIVFICDYDNLNQKFENPLKKKMFSHNNLGTLLRANKRDKSYSLPKIIISNSDYSYVVIRGFRINNDYHIFDYGQVLAKNSIVEMVSNFKFKYKNRINYISIIMQDILDNLYEIEVNYKIIGEGNCKKIKILSGIETKESDLIIKGRI
ncbi:MAG: hypothetical protein IJ538_02685 [Clostridia bacterium]|nr:hypothetical protein [Clostridia bacterium]